VQAMDRQKNRVCIVVMYAVWLCAFLSRDDHVMFITSIIGTLSLLFVRPDWSYDTHADAGDGYASDDTDAVITYGDSEWSEYDTEDADVDSE
jgi:hypothetical protein